MGKGEAGRGKGTALESEPLAITVDSERRVSALLLRPDTLRFVLVLAHGAGAGMRHPFLEQIARGLAAHDVGTLRYQFPYMEAGSKRPDTPAVATATVRAAVLAAAQVAPGTPLFAGGKSFGGRMTSTAAAQQPLPGVHGIVFLGFPLHAPGRPDTKRGDHLRAVTVPMLFLQGTRDEFADLTLLEPIVRQLGNRATLRLIDGGDHSFRVPKSASRTSTEIMGELVSTIAEWGTSRCPTTGS